MAPYEEVQFPAPSAYFDGLSAAVGARIRFEAAKRELTQEELALYLGRSRTAVNQRFLGKVAWSLDDVGRIAHAFGCPVSDLLDDRGLPKRMAGNAAFF